jgi:HK97 family phage major capsid protein
MQTRPISALPKGHAFTRAAIALINTKGDDVAAREYAKQRHWTDTAEYFDEMLERTAVAGGTTSDGSFAQPLVYSNFAASEFNEILRNGTIIGKMAGLRRCPFNVTVPRETSAGGASWVGEGLAVPVSKLQLTTDSLGFAKVAGMIAITKELAQFATPDAVGLIQTDLTKGSLDFIDQQLVDPGVAAVANVSPASITNGLTPIASTGSTAVQIAADLVLLLTALTDNNETDAPYLIMTRSDAIRLAAKRDTAGGLAFPDVKINGGSVFGVPIITSNSIPHSVSAGSIVVAVNAGGILYAENPNIELGASQNATLQMDSSPTQSIKAPTATNQVSMFQTNSVAVRVVAYRNWTRARSTAVQYLDNVHW